MIVLIVLSMIAGTVWLLAFYRSSIEIRPSWIAVGVIGCVLSQVVLGHDFWHLNISFLPVTFDRLILGATVVIWLIAMVRNRGEWLRLDGLDVAVLVWLGVITVSTLTNDWRFRNNLPLSRLLFFNLTPVVIYFLLKHTAMGLTERRWVIRSLIGLAVYLGVTAVAEWRGWHSFVFPQYIINSSFQEFFGRGRGPLLNPMINGMLMLVGATAAALLLVRATQRQRVGLVAVLGVIGMGCLATMTRSIWLAGAVSGVGLVLFMFQWRARVGLVLIGVAMAVVMLPIAKEGLSRFKRDRFVSEAEMEQSVQLRPMLATVAIEMIKDRPLQGTGFGLYHKFKGPYHYSSESGLPLQKVLVYTQHNVFLVYLVETGVLGFTAFLGMFAVVVYRCVLLCRDPWLDWEQRQWGLMGLSTISIYLINGMYHDVSIIPAAHTLVLMIVGTVGQLQTEASRASVTPNRVGSPWKPAVPLNTVTGSNSIVG